MIGWLRGWWERRTHPLRTLEVPLAKTVTLPIGTRYYGGTGTIHRTGHLDIEMHAGEVVSVWFRCSTVPYQVHEVDEARVREMRRVGYDTDDIEAIVFKPFMPDAT